MGILARINPCSGTPTHLFRNFAKTVIADERDSVTNQPAEKYFKDTLVDLRSRHEYTAELSRQSEKLQNSIQQKIGNETRAHQNALEHYRRLENAYREQAFPACSKQILADANVRLDVAAAGLTAKQKRYAVSVQKLKSVRGKLETAQNSEAHAREIHDEAKVRFERSKPEYLKAHTDLKKVSEKMNSALEKHRIHEIKLDELRQVEWARNKLTDAITVHPDDITALRELRARQHQRAINIIASDPLSTQKQRELIPLLIRLIAKSQARR